MSLSLVLHSARWRIAMDRLRNAMRREMGEFMTDQFRLLLEQIMRFTPPRSRAQGRARVAADIAKVARPFDLDNTTDKRLRQIIRAYDHPAFDAYAKAAGAPWRSIAFAPQIHQAARDRRGRVGRKGKRAPFVLGPLAERRLEQYVTHKQRNVGIARSGWSAALLRVGGTIPRWVSHHGTQYGGVVDRRQVADKPELLAINRTPWAGRRDEGLRIIREAMKSRTRRLETALRVQLRLAAQKSGLRVA